MAVLVPTNASQQVVAATQAGLSSRPRPSAASRIATKGKSLKGYGASKKHWAQYPPRDTDPPPGLTFSDLCAQYPNHLGGELLIEMSEAGLRPQDILEMMPADTRNNDLGTEHAFLSERLKKAILIRDRELWSARSTNNTPIKTEQATGSLNRASPAKLEASMTTAPALFDSSLRLSTAHNITEVSNVQAHGSLRTKPPDPTSSGASIVTMPSQFSFQPFPPASTPPSQWSAEFKLKHDLREEIRTHLRLSIEIASADETFTSRNPSDQQNDVLLGWKRWCDAKCLSFAQHYQVFVAPVSTGLVVKDSLDRLLCTLQKIYGRQGQETGGDIEEPGRKEALDYALWMFRDRTLSLQRQAATLPQAPILGLDTHHNSSGGLFGYYGVELSRVAMEAGQMAQENSADKFVRRLKEETTRSSAQESTISITTAQDPPSLRVSYKEHPHGIEAHHPCDACRTLRRACDRIMPACSHCVHNGRTCNYARG